MALSQRTVVLNDLAIRIARLQLARPIRVAIDGRTASGKTTLADELAELIEHSGREVIRTSIDGFHRPRAERYARGRYSPEGYYCDARDHAAINALLLAPLGPCGDRHYRTVSFDLKNDRPIQQEPRSASTRAILIVDGTFLQRPELRAGWDLTIFVETSARIAAQRGVRRDAAPLGGVESARQLYAARYQPAFDLYERLCSPAAIADVILNNEDIDRPHLHVRDDGRLAANTVLSSERPKER
jgi:uridine kinase